MKAIELHAVLVLDGRRVDRLAHDEDPSRGERNGHGDYGRHRHDDVAEEVAARFAQDVGTGEGHVAS